MVIDDFFAFPEIIKPCPVGIACSGCIKMNRGISSRDSRYDLLMKAEAEEDPFGAQLHHSVLYAPILFLVTFFKPESDHRLIILCRFTEFPIIESS